MSIWGKLADVAAGLAKGGAISALLSGGSHQAQNESPENQVAFTVGVIALGAKMAKADGVVTMDEVNAFKDVFKVPDGEMKNVARVFNLAKQDATGYEAYAEQLSTMFKGNRKVLEDVLEGLFHIAKADRVLHSNEELFLAQVSKRFRITETEFSYIKARHAAPTKRNPYYADLRVRIEPRRTTRERGCAGRAAAARRDPWAGRRAAGTRVRDSDERRRSAPAAAGRDPWTRFAVRRVRAAAPVVAFSSDADRLRAGGLYRRADRAVFFRRAR